MDVNKIINVWVGFNKIISQFLFRNMIYKFLIISFTKFFYIFVFYGRSNLEATKFLNGKKKKEIASPFQVHRGFQKTPVGSNSTLPGKHTDGRVFVYSESSPIYRDLPSLINYTSNVYTVYVVLV